MGLEAYSQTLWLGLQKLGGDTWGGLEFWGEGVASETRWREVLNSAVDVGREWKSEGFGEDWCRELAEWLASRAGQDREGEAEAVHGPRL